MPPIHFCLWSKANYALKVFEMPIKLKTHKSSPLKKMREPKYGKKALSDDVEKL